MLHFKNNRVELARQQRAAELQRLKEENEKLRERVTILEENDGKVYADVNEQVCCAVDVCFDVAGGRLDAAGRAEVEGGTAKQRAAPR